MPFGSRYGVVSHLRSRIAKLKNRLARARHFRGHGVHSPFVYAIVRQVFMFGRPIGSDTALRDALHAAGVNRRRARELQNLQTYCGYRSFAICATGQEQVQDQGHAQGLEQAELYVLLREAGRPVIQRVVERATGQGATVVVMAPYADRDRDLFCRSLVAGHGSTSVDNRGYLLIFNDERLPKQHYRI